MRQLFLLLPVLILLGGVTTFCAAEDGVIGPGDTLKITVLGEAELTRQTIVNEAGKVSIPLAGEVSVAGLTPTQAAEILTQQLAKYIKRPNVTVELAASARKGVVVTGAVKTPGAYQLESGGRLMDAIAAAGGVLPQCDLTKISITRGSDKTAATYDLVTYKQTADNSLNPEVESGDIVTVPDTIPITGEIFMTGEVVQRGAIPLREGMTVRDAVGAAGGFTANADPINSTIKHTGQPTSVSLNIAGAMQGDPAADVLLKNGDWIYIPAIQQQGTFSVFGEVNNPGIFPIRGKVQVTDAIAQAGGLTQRAKAAARVISASGGPVILDISKIMNGTAQNNEIKPGDTVFVDRRRQGIDPFRAIGAGASLLWAIIRIGGG